MIINIASKNPVKIEAIKWSFTLYEEFRKAKFNSIEVNSGVSNQPKTLEETITGATNRARNAFNDCDMSVGYEGGIMPSPYARTGYFSVGVCSIFDGKEIYHGFAPSFEYPTEIIKLVFEEDLEISDAFKKAGYRNPNYEEIKLGESIGGIGILTRGVVIRETLVSNACHMALLPILNKEKYKK
jgi:inosine/xanthosine triphosphatase